VFIEQAVFTSALTDRSGGYHLVARSRGVCDADARELSVWGPSHDSLLDPGPCGASVNFFPLPSGASCISKTGTAGGEYSGRGGYRIYTQCLLVPPEVLDRFAGNPFAVLRAALAAGVLRAFDEPPELLPPVRLGGRSPAVDQTLVAQVTKELGPSRLARLIKAALESPALGVASTVKADSLFCALINCLPVEQRRQFTFATGLRYSPQRPFRLITLPRDPAEQRALGRRADLEMLDLTTEGGPLGSLQGWAADVARYLAAGKFAAMARAIEGNDAPRPVSPGRASSAAVALAPRRPPSDTAPITETAVLRPASTTTVITPAEPSISVPNRAARPSGPDDSGNVDLLGRLDDCVFAALGGRPEGAAELRRLWPELSQRIHPALLEESREQYVRHVIQTWRSCLAASPLDTRRARWALDVLAELFGDG
jgi:hypothetical protein